VTKRDHLNVCIAPTGAGQFTIPSSVLLALPPTDTPSLSSLGFLVMGSVANLVQFTAPERRVG
jgi:hypothetical protein